MEIRTLSEPLQQQSLRNRKPLRRREYWTELLVGGSSEFQLFTPQCTPTTFKNMKAKSQSPAEAIKSMYWFARCGPWGKLPSEFIITRLTQPCNVALKKLVYCVTDLFECQPRFSGWRSLLTNRGVLLMGMGQAESYFFLAVSCYDKPAKQLTIPSIYIYSVFITTWLSFQTQATTM